LSCDNLRSVDIVLADGRMLTANRSQNEDLFWAVRGGGGNFGVVVSFEYQLHPMPPMITGGMVLYPMEQARDVLRFYRDYSAGGSDELAVNAGMLTTPDGMNVIGIFAAWFGAPERAAEQLQPLRAFGAPLADLIAPMPYAALQTIFDAAVPHGLRRYWKSGYIENLTDDVIDTMLSYVATKTSPYTLVLLFRLDGKAMRAAPDATAFGARTPQWDFDIVPQWTDASDDGENIEWARAFWRSIEPFTCGVYMNHLGTDDSATRVRAALGGNYERLLAVKRVYDPRNLFRMNNNIAP
jgi:FAD/FMN-containing dehydrogenase